MWIPRDLLDEVESELWLARRSLASAATHVDALERLHALALLTAAALGRPSTLLDLLHSGDEGERLVRKLRS
jgi:hypothetical protein